MSLSYNVRLKYVTTVLIQNFSICISLLPWGYLQEVLKPSRRPITIATSVEPM